MITSVTFEDLKPPKSAVDVFVQFVELPVVDSIAKNLSVDASISVAVEKLAASISVAVEKVAVKSVKVEDSPLVDT